jgi:putative oxidoreductase
MAQHYIGSHWSPETANAGMDQHAHPRSETVAHVIGRAMFGGFFLYNGINHLMHHQNMAGYAEAKGVPAASVAVQGTGVMLVLGGLSLLTGYKPKLGAALVAAFLAGVSPSMHAFWKESEPQQRQAEMINFMKNMALAGAAILAAGSPEPWPVSPAARTAA